MNPDRIRFWGRSKEEDTLQKKQELRDTAPERAAIAGINSAENGPDLRQADFNNASVRAERPEHASEIHDAHNRRSDELILKELEAHANDKGYAFTSLDDLKKIHALINNNSRVGEDGLGEYGKLWLKLEEKGIALLKSRVRQAEKPSQLEALREDIDTFPFVEKNLRDVAYRVFDEQAADIFKASIRQADAASELITLRTKIGGFPFHNPRVKTETDRILEETTVELFMSEIFNKDALLEYSSLVTDIQEFPFKDTNSREKLSGILDTRVKAFVERTLHDDLLPYQITALAARVNEFPFSNPSVKADVAAMIQAKLGKG